MNFKILVNGLIVSTNKNMSILQACESANVLVPRFCYHERLAIAGNCRMCLVEIDKAPKLIASCAMPVAPNMVVKTESLLVKKAREGILEFLLVNHPLDCPICDQGGECDLQDQAMFYGSDRGRFREFKRALEDKPCGPLIKTVMNRCIHCTRCVRFANEIIGITELGTTGRGNVIEISMYIKKLLKSEMSGNVIDLCPVGALTSKPYTFSARPWELKSVETIETFDSIGSSIKIDSRGYEIMRILPRLNEKLNEEWISDKSRFAFDGLKFQRLHNPLFKDRGVFKIISWQKAFSYLNQQLSSRETKKNIGGIIGPQADLESICLLKYLIEKTGGIFTRFQPLGLKNLDFQGAYRFNSTIFKIDACDACLIVGVNPRVEGSVVNFKLRKRYVKKALKLVCFGAPFDLSYPTSHCGSTLFSFLKFVEGKHPFCFYFSQAKAPMIVVGNLFFRMLGEKSCHILLTILIKNSRLQNSSWNGFNVLNAFASDLGAFDLGIVQKKKGVEKLKILYVLGDTPFIRLNVNTFIVYQGHHGNQSALQADLIIPGAAFSEKTAIFVNTEGRYQITTKAFLPVANAKTDWKILYTIIEKLGGCFQKDENIFMLKRLSCLLPFWLGDDLSFYVYQKKQISMPFYGKVKNTFFLSAQFENFYVSGFDSISGASPTMAKCSKALLNKLPFILF